ncbi:MAG: hypothetical protein NVSMB57_15050 [Actinomycetota bacterium]
MTPTTRYRCDACGNLTRFDVVATRRTREFHHFSLGGEVSVEEAEILSEDIEKITCRWCGASDKIETIDDTPAAPEAPKTETR